MIFLPDFVRFCTFFPGLCISHQCRRKLLSYYTSIFCCFLSGVGLGWSCTYPPVSNRMRCYRSLDIRRRGTKWICVTLEGRAELHNYEVANKLAGHLCQKSVQGFLLFLVPCREFRTMQYHMHSPHFVLPPRSGMLYCSYSSPPPFWQPPVAGRLSGGLASSVKRRAGKFWLARSRRCRHPGGGPSRRRGNGGPPHHSARPLLPAAPRRPAGAGPRRPRLPRPRCPGLRHAHHPVHGPRRPGRRLGPGWRHRAGGGGVGICPTLRWACRCPAGGESKIGPCDWGITPPESRHSGNAYSLMYVLSEGYSLAPEDSAISQSPHQLVRFCHPFP